MARLAEDAFLGLDPGQQAIARELLLRLADEDESGAVVRRRVALAELDAERTAVVSAARRPAAADGQPTAPSRSRTRRCCANGRDYAPGWTRTPRAGACTAALEDAARAWDADARDAGGLYRGARLAAALDWAAEHDAELSATERAFLDASRRASGRAQRRLRLVLAGVAALLVVAVIAGLVALDQRGDGARGGDDRRRAAPRRPGAHGRRARPRRCCSPARASRSTTRRRRAATSSRRCSGAPRRSACCASGGPRVNALALSPDGRTLAVLDATARCGCSTHARSSGSPRCRRWRGLVRSTRPASRPSGSATTARDSRSAAPTAGVLDARTGRRVASLPARERSSSPASASPPTGARSSVHRRQPAEGGGSPSSASTPHRPAARCAEVPGRSPQPVGAAGDG